MSDTADSESDTDGERDTPAELDDTGDARADTTGSAEAPQAETAPETTTEDWWRLTPEESRVPADREGPVAECPYCGRPFEDSHARTLHVGEVHRAECTDAERAAYEEADEAEVDDLFVYHLKAVVAIGLTWAAFVILYMVAIGSNII